MRETRQTDVDFDTPSDGKLLEEIHLGDTSALDTILSRYWQHVVRYAASMLDSADAAEDVAQETFVVLWARRETWKLLGSLKSLLLRIARNLAIDERRRAGARQRAASNAPTPRSPSTPEDEAHRSLLRTALAEAVNSLPERRREVFLLVRHQGLSYAEAAEVTGLAPQTVANHLGMALADLRVALARHAPQD